MPVTPFQSRQSADSPAASCRRHIHPPTRRRHQIPIAPAAPPVPNVPCLGAFWTPAATARGRGRHAGVQKPCMGLWKSSREFTACDFFLQLNFFVRLESPFLRPDPQCPNAVARRVCQGWPSLRYLLMLSAMPGQTLTNPSTAARSLWSGWTGRGELACRARTFVPQPCIRWGRNDPGP
jgi:hypothetical protein